MCVRIIKKFNRSAHIFSLDHRWMNENYEEQTILFDCSHDLLFNASFLLLSLSLPLMTSFMLNILVNTLFRCLWFGDNFLRLFSIKHLLILSFVVIKMLCLRQNHIISRIQWEKAVIYLFVMNELNKNAYKLLLCSKIYHINTRT